MRGGTAQGLLDPGSRLKDRIGRESERWRPSQARLDGDASLKCPPVVFESCPCPFGERGKQDPGVAEVGFAQHCSHGEQAKPFIGVGQALQLFGEDLLEQGVHPGDTGIRVLHPCVAGAIHR